MHDDDDWFEPAETRSSIVTDWGNNMLRFAMLFGVCAIAVALFAAPLLDRTSSRIASELNNPGIDFSTRTAATPHRSTYTLHRSVLQRSPTSVCVVHANGARTGDCGLK